MRTTLSTITATSNEWERDGLRSWNFGTLPRVVETGAVKAYPALVDEGESAAMARQRSSYSICRRGRVLNTRGKRKLAIRKKLTFSWQAAGVSS